MSAQRPKGLGETRTCVSTHSRATPPRNRQGHRFLEAYVLSLELKRLAEQLAPLDRQRDRIGRRMVQIRQEIAIRQDIAPLVSKPGDVPPSDGSPVASAVGEGPASAEAEPPGRTMTIGY